MPTPTLARRLSTMLLLGLLGQLLVACSDTAPPPPASQAPAQPAPSAASAGVTGIGPEYGPPDLLVAVLSARKPAITKNEAMCRARSRTVAS